MSRILPILFNTEMIRAILDDRKTTTRRLIMPHNRKNAKEHGYYQGNGLWIDFGIDNLDREGHIKDYSISDCWMRTRIYIQMYAPYHPGDILYVRETWCNANKEGVEPDYYYYADTIICEDYDSTEWKWRPSIHMPKQAARIWLRVTDVRVERLKEIMKDPPGPNNQVVKEGCRYGCDFIAVWEKIIKKSERDLYGWDANPWVWVIEFERCEKPEEDKHEHRISEGIKSETATV